MTATVLDLPALGEVGERLGRELPPGSVVWLSGALGAGKTTLAAAIVRGRGGTWPATSPTFALVHRYHGPRGDVHHVDCYRLARPEQSIDLDWETLARSDLLLIEWPERAEGWAPRPTCRITLQDAGPGARLVEIE